MAMQAEQQRIAQQQAEAQRQAVSCKLNNNVLQNNKPRLNVKRLCKLNNNVLRQQQAEAQRQAALRAEQGVSLHSKLNKLVSLKHNVKRRSKNVFVSRRNNAALYNNRPRAQRQAATAEQQRIAAEQAEAQRQAALQAEQQRIAAERAEAQRQAAGKLNNNVSPLEQAEAQRQAALKAEQERIAAEDQQRLAAMQAEQRIAAEQS